MGLVKRNFNGPLYRCHAVLYLSYKQKTISIVLMLSYRIIRPDNIGTMEFSKYANFPCITTSQNMVVPNLPILQSVFQREGKWEGRGGGGAWQRQGLPHTSFAPDIHIDVKNVRGPILNETIGKRGTENKIYSPTAHLKSNFSSSFDD